MNKVLLSIIALLSASTAALAATAEPPGPTSDGMPTFEDFERQVGTFPYKATAQRTSQTKDGARALRHCMTKKEVEAALGKPDFSQAMYGPKGPKPKWLGFFWTYYLAKRGNTTNMNDPGVEMFFHTSDRMQWVVPNGIEGAREIGGPKAKCA
jgi:hypothetical protein